MKKTAAILLSFAIIIISLSIFLPSDAYGQEALLKSTEGAKFSGEKCDATGNNCEKGCLETGDCQIRDFTVLLIRVSQIILGLTGSLSLLAFVYGGTMFLVSSGNKETVEKAKSTLIGAVVGMFIVFTSYTIIGFVFSAFDIPGGDKWASSSWFQNK